MGTEEEGMDNYFSTSKLFIRVVFDTYCMETIFKQLKSPSILVW